MLGGQSLATSLTQQPRKGLGSKGGTSSDLGWGVVTLGKLRQAGCEFKVSLDYTESSKLTSAT